MAVVSNGFLAVQYIRQRTTANTVLADAVLALQDGTVTLKMFVEQPDATDSSHLVVPLVSISRGRGAVRAAAALDSGLRRMADDLGLVTEPLQDTVFAKRAVTAADREKLRRSLALAQQVLDEVKARVD